MNLFERIENLLASDTNPTKDELLKLRKDIQRYRWEHCAYETEEDTEMPLLINDIDHKLWKDFGVLYPASKTTNAKIS